MSLVEKNQKINNRGGDADDYSGLESRYAKHLFRLNNFVEISSLTKSTFGFGTA